MKVLARSFKLLTIIFSAFCVIIAFFQITHASTHSYETSVDKAVSMLQCKAQLPGSTSSSPQETNLKKPSFQLPSKPSKMQVQQPKAMPDPLPAPGAMPDPLPSPPASQKLQIRKDTFAQSVSDLRPNTDLPGKDYNSLNLSTPDPNLCQQACINDPKCRAFTYVIPGVQGLNARCWLKADVPAPKPNPNCISGVVERLPRRQPFTPIPKGKMAQDNVDLPGMDYQHFDLPIAEPRLCLDACLGDPRCKAYTYVRPGSQGPNARCWLKDGVPQSKPNPACISGVVQRDTLSSPATTIPVRDRTITQLPPREQLRRPPESIKQSPKIHPKSKTWLDQGDEQFDTSIRGTKYGQNVLIY